MRNQSRLAFVTFFLALTFALAAAAQDPQRPSPQPVPETPEQIFEHRDEREMVLIHGLGGNADIWNECLPYLNGTFQVWTFELAGHGKTQPIGDPTIEKEAERLAAFLDEQGIVYPTLVGHALGGMVALQYTMEHPAEVARLILLDSAPMQLASQEHKAAVAVQLSTDYDKFIFSRFVNMTPDREVTELVLDTALRTDSATFISLLMSSFDFDLSNGLYRLPVPMLVVGSELMFPPERDSKHMLDHYGFGKARALSFKRMGGSGHFMMLERPVTLASVLMAFAISAEMQFEH